MYATSFAKSQNNRPLISHIRLHPLRTYFIWGITNDRSEFLHFLSERPFVTDHQMN